MKFLLLLLLPVSLAAQNSDLNNQGSANARAFVHSLDDVQRQKAVYPFEEMNRYEWHYLPATMVYRYGIGIKDLDTIQKANVYMLLKSFLSKEGYTKTRNIMDYEYLLKEMQPENVNRIPENYFIAVYGQPGDSIWGWKFSGHHVALNFTILDDQLAFAPFFFGVYPAEVKDGPKKGTRLLKDEEDLGFELVNSFSHQKREKAIFQLHAFSDIVSTNAEQVGPMKPVGIFAAEMTLEEKTILNKLIVAYLRSMPEAIGKTRMEKIVMEDMDSICFGWAGGTEPGIPHYYRVQGNSFMIEFDNTQNNANHIHTVWRDFNGDFGADLLREHYQHSKHHK
ncbi:MAG: DUF3500 domain-containing protein [Saprospiraceae bacterium]